MMLPRILLAVAVAGSTAAAFSGREGSANGSPSVEMMELIGPVALFPDPVLANILAAATYPVEVVLAARWVQTHGSLLDEALEIELAALHWEPAVQSLLSAPSLLIQMESGIDWLKELGDAVAATPGAVLNAVQEYRMQALAEGSLFLDTGNSVEIEGGAILIEPGSSRSYTLPDLEAPTDPGGKFSLEKMQYGIDWETREILFLPGLAVGPVPWRHDSMHRHGSPYSQPPTRAVRVMTSEALIDPSPGFERFTPGPPPRWSLKRGGRPLDRVAVRLPQAKGLLKEEAFGSRSIFELSGEPAAVDAAVHWAAQSEAAAPGP